MNKPVYQGRVTDLSHDGRGVVRVDGMVWFVDDVLPDEQITFQRGRRRRSHGEGRLLSIDEPSPERVAPPCPQFGVCGGCSLQHLDYNAQVQLKFRQLQEALSRIGKVEPHQWLSPMTGAPLSYRRRARLGVRDVEKKGGVLVGFRERRRSFVTPLEHCLTLHPRAAELLPDFPALVAAMSHPNRVPQIEVSVGDNATAIIVRHLEPLTQSDCDVLRRFAVDNDIWCYSQAHGPESVLPQWPVEIPPLTYQLPAYSLELQFGPADFIQVNAEMNKALVDKALTLLNPRNGETIYDFFCGLGNFSLPIATRGANVVGIELSPHMVRRATENASLNAISNTRFVSADLAQESMDALVPEHKVDAVVLDPPRSGALEVVKQWISKVNPERIVYISCNTATLARDAGILVNVQGYQLSCAGIADMFPHTGHVESIALFQR